MVLSPSPNSSFSPSYSHSTPRAKIPHTSPTNPTHLFRRIPIRLPNQPTIMPTFVSSGFYFIAPEAVRISWLLRCLLRWNQEKQPHAVLVLYYVVEYLLATQDIGHILQRSTSAALRIYCKVDASYLLHPDSKGQTGYNISFFGTIGTFRNCSVKQTAQYSLWPRKSISSSPSVNSSGSPLNYCPTTSSWKTTAPLL
jgi:hypothetical protein